MENITLLGGGALLSNDFIESIGTDGVGMYITSRPPPESQALQELISAYETKYDQSTRAVGFAYVYDATNLLFNAIEAVALQEEDGTLHIGRQALREALYATSRFEGVTGNFTCTKFGDCSSTSFTIVRLDDLAAGLEGLLSNVVYTYTPE